MKQLRHLLCALGLLVFPIRLVALTFAWDASQGAVSYNVYVGTNSGIYTDIVSSTNTTALLTNLQTSVRYYFVVTALNQFGMESDWSVEIFYTILPPRRQLKLTSYLLQSDDLLSWRTNAAPVFFTLPDTNTFYKMLLVPTLE